MMLGIGIQYTSQRLQTLPPESLITTPARHHAQYTSILLWTVITSDLTRPRELQTHGPIYGTISLERIPFYRLRLTWFMSAVQAL